MPPRIEPEGSTWVTHWRRSSALDKIGLGTLLAVAAILTIQWFRDAESAVRVMLAWSSAAFYWWRWPPSEKIAPALTELRLRRTRSHRSFVVASDSLEPETDVRGRSGVG